MPIGQDISRTAGAAGNGERQEGPSLRGGAVKVWGTQRCPHLGVLASRAVREWVPGILSPLVWVIGYNSCRE